MEPKSPIEDLLLVLLWGAEQMMVPTWGSLFQTFEWWDYKRQLRHRVRSLENRQLLVREKRANRAVYQLTARGRLAALGGRDPEAWWRRTWDGQWRLILFDLPSSQKVVRVRLWRWLRANGFGYLQHSVWISPDPIREVTDSLRGFREDVEMFNLMEARCCAEYSDAAIVQGAWDFTEINRRYEAYLRVATTELRQLPEGDGRAQALGRWLRRERFLWLQALTIDPLLPRGLLPAGYLGLRAWQAHCQAVPTILKSLANK